MEPLQVNLVPAGVNQAMQPAVAPNAGVGGTDEKVQVVGQPAIKSTDTVAKESLCKRAVTWVKNILEKFFCCFCRYIKKKNQSVTPVKEPTPQEVELKKAVETKNAWIEKAKTANKSDDIKVLEVIENPDFLKDPEAFVKKLPPNDPALPFFYKELKLDAKVPEENVPPPPPSTPEEQPPIENQPEEQPPVDEKGKRKSQEPKSQRNSAIIPTNELEQKLKARQDKIPVKQSVKQVRPPRKDLPKPGVVPIKPQPELSKDDLKMEKKEAFSESDGSEGIPPPPPSRPSSGNPTPKVPPKRKPFKGPKPLPKIPVEKKSMEAITEMMKNQFIKANSTDESEEGKKEGLELWEKFRAHMRIETSEDQTEETESEKPVESEEITVVEPEKPIETQQSTESQKVVESETPTEPQKVVEPEKSIETQQSTEPEKKDQ